MGEPPCQQAKKPGLTQRARNMMRANFQVSQARDSTTGAPPLQPTPPPPPPPPPPTNMSQCHGFEAQTAQVGSSASLEHSLSGGPTLAQHTFVKARKFDAHDWSVAGPIGGPDSARPTGKQQSHSKYHAKSSFANANANYINQTMEQTVPGADIRTLKTRMQKGALHSRTGQPVAPAGPCHQNSRQQQQQAKCPAAGERFAR